MVQGDDLSRSLADFRQESTLIAVIEMSQSSWFVAGIIPGVEQHALKKIEPNENIASFVSLASESKQDRARDQTHCCCF